MEYFQRTGPHTFRPTSHVSGAWQIKEQHVGPAFGLLAHLVETDLSRRRDDGLTTARLSYDILGTMTMDEVETSVRVTRPGRSVELVEAVMSQAGRDAVVLRAWNMQGRDTRALAGSPLSALPRPEEMPAWNPSSLWQGGFIASAEVRRSELGQGRAHYWVRTPVTLLADEPVSALAYVAGLLDIANGMAARVDPLSVAFPNVDLTVHLFESPKGEWVGFDTSVTFGSGGIGVTHSTIHDCEGPVGHMSQILTVRP